jgi:hypothetical protein
MSSWGFDRAQAQYDAATPDYLDAPGCDWEHDDHPCPEEGEYELGDEILCQQHYNETMLDASE